MEWSTVDKLELPSYESLPFAPCFYRSLPFPSYLASGPPIRVNGKTEHPITELHSENMHESAIAASQAEDGRLKSYPIPAV